MAHKTATVAERIRLTFGSLTAAERRIGQILLSNYPVAGLKTVQSLAERAEVSPATIVRFIKAIGFSGFRQFQDTLRDEVALRGHSTLSQTTNSDRVEHLRKAGAAERNIHGDSWYAPSLSALLDSTQETFSSLPRHEVDAFTELLADPKKRIRVCGGQFSHVAAQHLVSQLSLFRGGISLVPADPLQLANELLDLRHRRDVWVFFDFRRYSTHLHEIAAQAKAQGAQIALITDRWLSPIAAYASPVLTSHVEAAGPSDSIVPALTLVEVLCECAVQQLGDLGLNRLQKIEEMRDKRF